MAGQTMDLVLAGARLVIASITPDYEPTTLFVPASMRLPMELLPFPNPADGTRAFHVISGIVAGLGGPSTGGFNAGSLHHLVDHFVVRVRYHCPFTADGYSRLNNFASTDAQRIYQALAHSSNAEWGGDTGHPTTVMPMGSASPIPINSDSPENDAWILDIPFRIQTFLSE